MNYSVMIGFENAYKTDKQLSGQLLINKEKNNAGLSSLIEGQIIKGTVISVAEQLILDFNEQMVTVSKDLLKSAEPGQVKSFEVVKVIGNQIELKLKEELTETMKQSCNTSIIVDKDQEAILSKNDITALKADQEAELQEIVKKLEELISKLTEEDCRRLEQEGFSVESFSITGLCAAINRVKACISSDKNSEENGTVKKMSSYNKESIAERLKLQNLPPISVNIMNIQKTLDLSEIVTKMDDKTIHYLISMDAEPTVRNIYKAYYSGNTNAKQVLNPEDWSELEGQVKEVITQAGYEVSEDNMNTAKWLIENRLPMTADTLTYKKELEELKKTTDKDTILNKLLLGVQNGINPMDVSIIEKKLMSGEQVIRDIQSIQPETLTLAVQNGIEITIRNLAMLQEGADISVSERSNIDEDNADIADAEASNTEEPTVVDADHRYEEIKARRQLEEIRLKMTLEAANQLQKKGISIETEQLSKVVDALKELEDNYYKEFLKEAEVEITESSIQLLKDTTKSVDQLKYLPNYILGKTLTDNNAQTIPNLLTEGMKLQSVLEKAGIAYETLMTVPSSEYGDSIQKAFANVESLLSELHIENSVENQKAARILGYNQMELSQVNINRVKAYDLQLSRMINNLHPAVTVRMIKEGINPLEIPINELNQTIDRIKQEQGINAEDKFSTYLRKLEKENGITQEERKAYIGIYRLLYNVEKGDGAALGAVMKANQEVTLDHLLTAIQTGRKGRLEAVINDEFGMLQGLSRNKESISEQLSIFADNRQQSSAVLTQNDVLQAQSEYMDQIIKQIVEEVSPEKLQKVAAYITEMGLQGQSNKVANSVSSEGIWATVKDTPVDKLFEMLENTGEETNKQVEIESYQTKVQEIREICKNSEQSIRFLNDYHVPSSPLNIMMAKNLIANADSPIKRLLKLRKENNVEKSENSLKNLNDLSDRLIDKHSMEEGYTQLETDVMAELSQTYSEEKIDTWKLAELKSIGQQMTFVRTLAEKEFYQIPIETDKGITNLNLTIIRGTQTTGKVSVSINSDLLGNVKADFSLKNNQLKGFISSDSRVGLEQLKSNSGEIEIAALENGVTLKQLDYGYQRSNTDTYSYQHTLSGDETANQDADTERILYRLAKAIVHSVRSAENSGTDKDLAVS